MIRKSVKRLPISPATVMAFIAMVFAISGFAVAAIPAPDGKIHGCYKKNKGTLRIVSHTKKCKKSERRITWNQQGPQGPAGAQGAVGAQGAPGANGAAGANGASSVVFRRENAGTIGAGQFAEAKPSCQAGEKLIGGGGGFLNAAGTTYSLDGQIASNGPANNTAPVADQATTLGWYTSGQNTAGTDRTFIGYAICAQP